MIRFGVEDGDCSDITCVGLTYSGQEPSPGLFDVDFGIQPLITSKVFVEFKAKIAGEPHDPYPFDEVSLLAVNDDLYAQATTNPAGSPWAWYPWAEIQGQDYRWYTFSIPADQNGDGVVDWTAGVNHLYMITWSGYSPAPSVSAWDTFVVSLDYDGNGVPDYRDVKDQLKLGVYWGPKDARTLAYANSGTLTAGEFDVNPVVGAPTSISGTGTLPSTIIGGATVTFNITYGWVTKRWSGTVVLGDPGAGFFASIAVHAARLEVMRSGTSTVGRLWGIKAQSAPQKCFMVVFQINDLS